MLISENIEASRRLQGQYMGPFIRFILSCDGQKVLSDNSSILARWSEHFQSLISANRNVTDTAIHHITQFPFKQELDKPPTLQETIEAIAHLQCHKAAGVDGNPPVIWNINGPMLHVKLYDHLVCCLKQGQ